MHLNLFAHGCGHHSAAWRAPGSAVDRLGDVTWWEDLARTAERGRFDAVFLADGQSLSPTPGPSWFLEPVTALTALARATTRIGLVSTISSTFWDPFHTARLSASLDHISGGRAGINVVTSMTDAEARNHGMDRLPDHEERYARAAEFIGAVTALWESWPAGSPPTAAVPVDHHGHFFDVDGPLNIPATPQGHPVLFQAGASEPGRDLAARYAEGVYAVAWDLGSARDYRMDLRRRAAEYGRDPDNLVIMPGLVTFVGATEEEARAKQRELNELLPVADSLRQLSFFVGRDTSGWALDEPVPDLPPLAEFTGPAGRYATILRILASSPDGRPTVRDLLGYLAAGGGHATFVGTPEQIADEMERWVVNGAADGFNLMPPTLPGGLDDVVDLVVPVLQERGLFRREYTADTLRGHLTSRCRHHAA
ncbi:LLM class flavin-dependent oxidoreductase [Corynebacterium variabile]|uniref:Monooxygenase n=2 Tax=Corynebacterium variabile TaxID=1727 RepID=A0A4Y4C168_9CORY|nr:LLM class flavin-dependent oxidoreductase [Corynebacterium variabile]GEC85174.1 monooxygenase [Corynebacterium variabile]